ncbi:hypothetical protein MTO96_004234 [Rhipicephalus appendiculatus]
MRTRFLAQRLPYRYARVQPRTLSDRGAFSSLKKGKRTAGREGPSSWMDRGTTTAEAAADAATSSHTRRRRSPDRGRPAQTPKISAATSPPLPALLAAPRTSRATLRKSKDATERRQVGAL